MFIQVHCKKVAMFSKAATLHSVKKVQYTTSIKWTLKSCISPVFLSMPFKSQCQSGITGTCIWNWSFIIKAYLWHKVQTTARSKYVLHRQLINNKTANPFFFASYWQSCHRYCNKKWLTISATNKRNLSFNIPKLK